MFEQSQFHFNCIKLEANYINNYQNNAIFLITTSTNF